MKPPKKDPKDLDSVVKLVKKLSNKVVDIMKNVDEGTLRTRPFLLFFKINDNTLKCCSCATSGSHSPQKSTRRTIYTIKEVSGRN